MFTISYGYEDSNTLNVHGTEISLFQNLGLRKCRIKTQSELATFKWSH